MDTYQSCGFPSQTSRNNVRGNVRHAEIDRLLRLYIRFLTNGQPSVSARSGISFSIPGAASPHFGERWAACNFAERLFAP